MKKLIVVGIIVGVLYVALTAYALIQYTRYVDTSPVDDKIESMIADADKELWAVLEHKPEAQRRAEVIPYATYSRVSAMGADELVVVALLRAERFRGRLIASADSTSAPGLADRTRGIFLK